MNGIKISYFFHKTSYFLAVLASYFFFWSVTPVNVYKGKGNALECSSYRGIKLLDHVLKELERVLEARLRKTVKIDDMQFGFSPGKGTRDAIFLLYGRFRKSYLASRRSCGWL